MKRVSMIFLLFTYIVIPAAYSQIQPLTGNELPGAILVNSNTYTPETIWNYNSNSAPVLDRKSVV